MATIILSTVGSALGGPIGGLLGSMVGGAIDQQLMGGGPRKGPRLGDLTVQTSSYGTVIPRIYGTMRVAGTVVWSTDLVETATLVGDGKSGPQTEAYSYSASFAVALSSRPIVEVKRIWADGKLVRGAAGDMKVDGAVRFLTGDPDQPIDPLIASIEGIANTPAYRGTALAIFENLQLGSFGNRIPVLTFEVVADSASTLGSMLRDGSAGLVDIDDARDVDGFALYGSDVGAAIEPLVSMFAVDVVDDGQKLRSPAADPLVAVDASAMALTDDGRSDSRPRRRQLPAQSLATTATVQYYDATRDYQSGQARAVIPGLRHAARSLTLPAVMTATAAKAMADDLLAREWAMRERVTFHLTPAHCTLQPGDVVTSDMLAGHWTVDRLTIGQDGVTAECRPAWAGSSGHAADPGRAVGQPDVVALPPAIVLLDLDDVGSEGIEAHSIQVAVASPSNTYRPLALEYSSPTGTAVASSAPIESIVGECVGVLADGQAGLFDTQSSIEVKLTNDEHWLTSCDDLALSNGANLAAIGGEIIQFGTAEAIGPERFRLTRLLRGCRGSEWAMSGHGPEEPFVLLDRRAMSALPIDAGMVGQAVEVRALGVHGGNVTASCVATGAASKPLSPSHLRGSLGAGLLSLSWVPRSRSGWQWRDEVDVPADPDFAGFRVSVVGTASSQEIDTFGTEAQFGASEIAALGTLVSASVRQIGRYGLSRPTTISFQE